MLQESTEQLAIALKNWERAVNEAYKKELEEQKKGIFPFPHRQAQITLQERLKKLCKNSTFTSVQATAIQSAWQAWRPPQKKPISPRRINPQ